ncbi:hypothetical protein [Thiohalophilus sp.]|uniref:hypothetical protein n=1 Tax=Thiohalophilus sp. TaxID=3028392 RepID=UPI002ACD3B90|nr:hypothetical protein [Thiohalophilus sp.]MDZ7661226.1 hypothetical protein [Thiohalophilus sp.]
MAAVSLAACAANTTTSEKDDVLLEAHQHGRIHIFYDRETFAEFMQNGEMYRHGRIYVFNSYQDMKAVRDTGHAAYFYTEIASGPKGEIVIHVLNNDNKKQKPIDLIKAFKEFHAKQVFRIPDHFVQKIASLRSQ